VPVVSVPNVCSWEYNCNTARRSLSIPASENKTLSHFGSAIRKIQTLIRVIRVIKFIRVIRINRVISVIRVIRVISVIRVIRVIRGL
jgi:hypothetical protein